ncbi:hypothetical protein P7K49_020787 [Saguinus oedipus]|uniref:Small ribosomal subunit protein uS2 C-terminal domain-containing protein n=1 Tax=Saguinus oedipus TaxID=9490 RepID=A0ABQ9UQS2_SAGOE|nr:hypothetical protein P7K49_020787 [Saguinus oedipus]
MLHQDVFWIPVASRETFTLSKAFDVLQMKEDVLKSLAAGTHLGGTNVDFQRKNDSIYIISLKRIWEKLLLAAHLLLPSKTLLRSVSCPPGILASGYPGEIDMEEQAAAGKAVTKEEFQSEWTALAPDSTATQPEVAEWSEGVQMPPVAIQQVATEDYHAQPAMEECSAAPPAQATEGIGTTTR